MKTDLCWENHLKGTVVSDQASQAALQGGSWGNKYIGLLSFLPIVGQTGQTQTGQTQTEAKSQKPGSQWCFHISQLPWKQNRAKNNEYLERPTGDFQYMCELMPSGFTVYGLSPKQLL